MKQQLAIRKTIVAEILGGRGWEYFWESRFLPRWIPLLLGLALGVASAYSIVSESWHLALPLAFAVPAIILFNRYPFVAVMLWLLIIPYFLNEPTTSGRFIYWVAHRAIIPTALGVAILSDWLGVRKREPVRLGRAELSMLIFLGLIVVNILLFNSNPMSALIHAYDRIFIPLCLYWLIRLVAPGEKSLRLFLWVAFVTLIVQSTIGLISWFNPGLLPDKWLGLEGARTVGSLRNVAVYTSTLLFCSLLLFHQAFQVESRWLRLGLLAVFGLALFCIYMSFSRGSWLGEVVVLLALIFAFPKRMIRLTLVVAVVAFVLSGSLLAEQVAWGYERLTGEAAQQSAQSRTTANYASIKMLEAKPFLGWGYGNYDQAKQPFMQRVGNVAVYDETSHNTYLTILAEFGLAGFFFYLFPVGWWLILSLRVWRRLPASGFWNGSLLLLLWLVMLHIFIVTNFMDMIRYHPFGTTLWWMVLGLIANLVYPYLQPGDIGAPSWARQAVARS